MRSPRPSIAPSPLRRTRTYNSNVEDPTEPVENREVDLDEEADGDDGLVTEPIEDEQELLNRLLHASGHTANGATLNGAVPESLNIPSNPLASQLHRILATLTRPPSKQPPPFTVPFDDESSNEALMAVLSLMRGTVERGEGNSCLVLGAKGSGKTRVS
jgi:origin recognition complex subunit 4